MKKIIAAMLAGMIVLTGCTGANTDKNKSTSANIQKEKSIEDEQGEGTKTRENEEKNMEEEENRKNENITEENHREDEIEKKDIEINITEDRFDLRDIFSSRSGAIYVYSQEDKILKMEKYLGSSRFTRGIGVSYTFALMDYNEKDGFIIDGKEVYSYGNLNGDKVEVQVDGISIQKEPAIKKEEYFGEYNSSLYGKIPVNFLVTKWDSDELVLRIDGIFTSGREMPKGYMEEYTFNKGKWITGIKIKDGKDGEEYNISVDDLNGKQLKSFQATIWNEVEEKYIEPIQGAEGYFQLNDEYFSNLNMELEDGLNKVQKDEYEKVLLQYYRRMPDYSLNAISNIVPMVSIVQKKDYDMKYLMMAVEEYERRIDALNSIYYKDNVSLPQISDGRDLYYDYWTGKFLGVSELEGEYKIRMDRYLKNRVRIEPVDEEEKMFACSPDFIDEFDKVVLSEEFQKYSEFKRYEYYGDKKNQYNMRVALVDALISMEEANELKGLDYKKYEENLFGVLIKRDSEYFEVKGKYINKLDLYLKKGPMTQYFSEVSKIKELIGYGNIYTRELNDYLNSLATVGLSQERMKELESNTGKIDEIKYYSMTKEHYEPLEEIDTDNAVEVWNADELMSAIKDNAVIKLMDDVVVNTLCTSSDKVEIDRFRVTVSGVNNLTIIGDGDYPKNIAVDSQHDAILFEECSNITLRNLSIGHTWIVCTGPVIAARKSSEIRVEDSIIYGCGVIGFDYQNVEDVEVRNTLIWDCQMSAGYFENVKRGELKNIIITRNGENRIRYVDCEDIEKENINGADSDKR